MRIDNELKKSRDVQAMPPTGATTGIGTLLAESRLEVVSVHYTGSTTVETTDTHRLYLYVYARRMEQFTRKRTCV